MSEFIITQNLIIDNREDVERRIAELSGSASISLDTIKEFILSEETTIFYIDEKMTLRTEGEQGLRYAWLDSGYLDTKGRPIFISLYYTMGYFTGSYVGSYGALAQSMMSHSPHLTKYIKDNVGKFGPKYEKRISKRQVMHLEIIEPEYIEVDEEEIEYVEESGIGRMISDAGFNDTNLKDDDEDKIVEKEITYPKDLTAVTEEIYGQLLFPSWNSIDGLDRYLKVIGCRITQLKEQRKTEYFQINNIQSVIVNTGLMNQFGADFMVLYRVNMKYGIYEAYQVMNGKTDWIANGFSKEQTSAKIKPICFFNENEREFSPEIEDFDINYKSLLHIIEERRNRFPEGTEDMSNNQIATVLQNALERGLKMQQRDSSYAKAIYSTKTGSISWVLPFHVTRKLAEEPELVLVIRRNKEFYEIKTILPYDSDMKDKITGLSLYSKCF